MSKKRLAFVAIIVIISLISLSSCTDSNVGKDTHQSSPKYNFEETDPYSIDMGSSLNITKVNDKFHRYDEPVMYDGSPISLKYRFSMSGPEQNNGQILFLIEGILQPFKIENDQTEYNIYNTEFESDQSYDVTFIIDPLIISKSSEVTLTIVYIVGYDRMLNDTSRLPPPMTTYNSLSLGILPIDESIQEKLIPENIASTQVDLVEDFSEKGYKSPDIYYFNSNDVEADSDYYLEYNKSNPEPLFAKLTGSQSDYRTIIFMNGQPIRAFNKMYYLDWSNKSEFDRISAQIDSDVLAVEGKHWVYSISFNLNANILEGDSQFSFVEVSKPVTLVIEDG